MLCKDETLYKIGTVDRPNHLYNDVIPYYTCIRMGHLEKVIKSQLNGSYISVILLSLISPIVRRSCTVVKLFCFKSTVQLSAIRQISRRIVSS